MVVLTLAQRVWNRDVAMVPTFAWEEHATLTLPLRTAGRLVEGLQCSSGGGEVIDDGL